MRKLIAFIGLVGTLTFISGLIPARLTGADLPNGTYSVCRKLGEDVVVAAGWPFAFIYDGNVTSPVCSTGWSQVWLFEDVISLPRLTVTILMSALLAALILWSVSRFRRNEA